ncbi:MAG: nickel-dependent hydrogenase large subunit [Polyangiaceae bacterium]
MIGEHLWRLGLDWPARLGLPPRREALLAWRRQGKVQDWPRWEALQAPALELAPSNDPGIPLLETLDASAWWQAISQDQDWERLAAYALAPTWAGQPRESGAAARCIRHPEVAALWQQRRRIAARLRARCLELEVLGQGFWDTAWSDAWAPAPGLGLARVETARGPLLHLVRLEAGRVARYVIVAPTEWNFHPAGALVHDAAGLPAPTPEAALDLARTLALALDPCVDAAFTLD